jgi:hypothetical protein
LNRSRAWPNRAGSATTCWYKSLSKGGQMVEQSPGPLPPTGGHGPPPSLTVYCSCGSWHLSSRRLLAACSLLRPTPNSGTISAFSFTSCVRSVRCGRTFAVTIVSRRHRGQPSPEPGASLFRSWRRWQTAPC